MNNITGVILAAGMGKRLGAITKDKPKALVEVGEKALLDYAIKFIDKIGIKNKIVVGGYCFDQIKKHVDKKYSRDVVLVENSKYELQNLVSFSKALELIDGEKGLLVCNADYIFNQSTVDAVKNNMGDLAVYCSFDLSGNEEDVMKVKVDKTGNMTTISKTLSDFDCIYTGIFFIPAADIGLLKEITRDILSTQDNKITTVECLFPEFIRRGRVVKIVDIGPADWLEIDTPEELNIAQKIKYENGHQGQ